MHGPALSSRSFDMYHMCAGSRWVWNPQMLPAFAMHGCWSLYPGPDCTQQTAATFTRGGRKTAGLASGYVVGVKVGGNFLGKRETLKNQYFLPPHFMIKDLTVYCKLYTYIFCQSSYKKKFPFWEVHGEDRKKKVFRKTCEVNDFSFFLSVLHFLFFLGQIKIQVGQRWMTSGENSWREGEPLKKRESLQKKIINTFFYFHRTTPKQFPNDHFVWQ